MMMTKGLIGKKLGMTQIFSDEGVSVPVTVIEVEPSVVIQKKTRRRMATMPSNWDMGGSSSAM